MDWLSWVTGLVEGLVLGLPVWWAVDRVVTPRAVRSIERLLRGAR